VLALTKKYDIKWSDYGFAHLLKQYAMRKMERIVLEFHLEDL
jgi:hypothetical protein